MLEMPYCSGVQNQVLHICTLQQGAICKKRTCFLEGINAQKGLSLLFPGSVSTAKMRKLPAIALLLSVFAIIESEASGRLKREENIPRYFFSFYVWPPLLFLLRRGGGGVIKRVLGVGGFEGCVCGYYHRLEHL